MKKTKILFILWAIIVVVIVVLLTIMGYILDSRYEKYQVLENKLEKSAENFIKDNILLEEKEEYFINSDLLIEKGYLEDLKIDNDVCKGYVLIVNDGNYKYNAYISCKQYTTKNYDEKK